jgi:manganese/zinc/iron transport system permease protein
MTIVELFTDAQFLWTLVVASVCSLSCALVGGFLVLKRMSLMGDAINHGILPGIVLAVLLSGQLTSWYLFVGAMLFGVLTAFLAQTLNSLGQVSEDASLGVVFTSFFALGVLLISGLLRQAHLDLNCVFMGTLDGVSLKVGDVLPVQLLGLASAILFLVLFWKEMKIAVFDPDLATAMGFSALLLHYLLIAMVAGVTVTTFEAVGSILVLAMLIVPAATAHLLTDRLATFFVWTGAVALVSALVGCLLAFAIDASSPGMIALAAGGQFLAAVFFAPRHGLVAKLLRQWSLTLRIAGEDVLSALYRAEESGTPPASLTQPEHGFSPWTERMALWRLRGKNLIEPLGQGQWRLTHPGKEMAQLVVRAHRLWEKFLAENFVLPLDHLHGPASWMEHFLGPELQNQLADQLHEPGLDPHGKTIPPKKAPANPSTK